MSVIDVKLTALYQASHDELPAKAHAFGATADYLSGCTDDLVAGATAAGNHPIGSDVLDLAEELFLHLRSMVRTFNDTAVALDRFADDLVATDEQAKQWMEQHQRYVGDPDTAPLPTPPATTTTHR